MTTQPNQPRNSFVFYRSFYEATSELPKEDRLELFDAIINYGLNGTEPHFTDIKKSFFMLIKPTLDANRKKYENGLKGGAPKGNKNALKTTEKQPKFNLNSTEIQPKNNQNSTKKQAKNNRKTTHDDVDDDVDEELLSSLRLANGVKNGTLTRGFI